MSILPCPGIPLPQLSPKFDDIKVGMIVIVNWSDGKRYKAQIIHIPQSLTSAVIMWVRFLALILASLGQIRGQVDIHQKSKDGMIRVPHNESEGTGEIYTSMHQLNKFFEEEKDAVEDLKMIIEKKLVSQAAVTGK